MSNVLRFITRKDFGEWVLEYYYDNTDYQYIGTIKNKKGVKLGVAGNTLPKLFSDAEEARSIYVRRCEMYGTD
jgi:hypothetical protein